AGAGKGRATWWKIGELNQPGVLAGAVSMAMRAKLIVVATRGAEGLPLPFYVWVNGWLPHRFSAAGALVALLGTPEEPGCQPGRVKDYLRAAARLGRLDFLMQEHKRAEKAPNTKLQAPEKLQLPGSKPALLKGHSRGRRRLE